VWDGWNLIEEYQAANNGAMTAGYVYGAGGLIAGVTNGQFNYYYQDASGSTSHVANTSGVLQEWYRYDLQGKPIVNDDPNNHVSAFGVRHLFTGQQWYSQVGLYDLRSRFYSPDIGRFLQPDPSGFNGDPTNLYRYCGNNPVTRRDPSGLDEQVRGIEITYPRVWVFGFSIDNYGYGPGYFGAPLGTGFGDPSLGIRGGGGWYFSLGLGGFGSTWRGIPFRLEDDQLSVQHSLPSSVPSQNPDPNGWWNLFSGGPSWDPFWKFMSSTNATPEQIAWTDTGRLPTLILGGIVLAPLAVPETGLYAATAIYNALVTAGNVAASGTNVAVTGANAAASWTAYQMYANPQAVINTTHFIEGAAPGTGPVGYTTWAGFWGTVTGQVLWGDH